MTPEIIIRMVAKVDGVVNGIQKARDVYHQLKMGVKTQALAESIEIERKIAKYKKQILEIRKLFNKI